MSSKKTRKINNKKKGGASTLKDAETEIIKNKIKILKPLLERLIEYYRKLNNTATIGSQEQKTYNALLSRYTSIMGKLGEQNGFSINELNILITEFQMDSIKINLASWKARFELISQQCQQNENAIKEANLMKTELKNTTDYINIISDDIKKILNSRPQKGGNSYGSSPTKKVTDTYTPKTFKYAELDASKARDLKPFYNNFLDTLDSFSNMINSKHNLNETNRDLVRKLIEKLEEKTSEILKKDETIRKQNEFIRQYNEFFDVLNDFNSRAESTLKRINKIMDQYGKEDLYINDFISSVQ